jgi:antitoxin YefM
MKIATYRHARAHLATLWNHIEDDRSPIVLQRRGHADMAMLPADELASLQATVYLLRSPKNAARLLTALSRSLHETEPAIERAPVCAERGHPSNR